MDLGRGDRLFHDPIFVSIKEALWNYTGIPHETLRLNSHA